MSNAAEKLDDMLSLTQQESLRKLIEKGLPLSAKPYELLANEINANEQAVINCIENWQQNGLIKRFGMVVRHRKLGYIANAMVVWDIPNEQVEEVASKLAKEPCVTLCYRRPRVLPHWPYNLFCMVHGKCRKQVEASVENLVIRLGLSHINKHLLFSTKAYKQQGARYLNSSSGEK